MVGLNALPDGADTLPMETEVGLLDEEYPLLVTVAVMAELVTPVC